MTLYRFSDSSWSESPAYLDIYTVVGETPCGYYIEDPYSAREKRWVSKTTRKRWAYPTKEEAWVSYVSRKKRQVLILTGQLDTAKYRLAKTEKEGMPAKDFKLDEGSDDQLENWFA